MLLPNFNQKAMCKRCQKHGGKWFVNFITIVACFYVISCYVISEQQNHVCSPQADWTLVCSCYIKYQVCLSSQVHCRYAYKHISVCCDTLRKKCTKHPQYAHRLVSINQIRVPTKNLKKKNHWLSLTFSLTWTQISLTIFCILQEVLSAAWNDTLDFSDENHNIV